MDDSATLTLDHDAVLLVMALLRERAATGRTVLDRMDATAALDAVEREYYGSTSARPVPAT